MNVLSLQAALGVVQDDALGPKTFAAVLERIGEPGERRTMLASAMAHFLPLAGIDTRLRTIHFLAQASHETTGFRHLTELGGPAYLSRYDGREDLGNCQPGDGVRFCGRGVFQLTGRANYAAFGHELGLDLVGNPGLAADPLTAVRIACLYWTQRALNVLADADDVEAITRKINGGRNGLADRRDLVAKLKNLWPA